MIVSDDISVIVQGKIDEKYTPKCLNSIREFLPNAEIILSTWKSEDVEGLSFDKLVMSYDIGPGSVDKLGIVNNINRQLVSTKNGLEHVTKPYILKIRSDMCLNSCEFLRLFDYYSNEAKLFEKRIMVCDYYTRNPRIIPMPFHISDWVYFGLTKDVKSFFCGVQLQTAQDDKWFVERNNKHCFFSAMLTRYAPEQHICISFLKQHYNLVCNDYADNTIDNIELTEKVLAHNFIVADSLKIGFKFLKYNPNRFKEKLSVISFNDWLSLYSYYCCGKIFLYYKIRCYLKKIVYFYIRRGISRILDILKIKNLIRKILSLQ